MSFWTQERLTQLADLLEQGSSYTRIGMILGCSRSQVGGKVARLYGRRTPIREELEPPPTIIYEIFTTRPRTCSAIIDFTQDGASYCEASIDRGSYCDHHYRLYHRPTAPIDLRGIPL